MVRCATVDDVPPPLPAAAMEGRLLLATLCHAHGLRSLLVLGRHHSGGFRGGLFCETHLWGYTFDYIIALLERTPGSPTLTFEKLYVILTRVKMACKLQYLPLSPAFNKANLYHLHPKILATKWRMDIDESGYWKPHVTNSPTLSVPKISKAVAACKKIN